MTVVRLDTDRTEPRDTISVRLSASVVIELEPPYDDADIHDAAIHELHYNLVDASLIHWEKIKP